MEGRLASPHADWQRQAAVGGSDLWQVDTAPPGWIEIEERRACQEPADRLVGTGSDSTAVTRIDERHEQVAVSDVTRAID
jgi:hypothetical protein